MLSTTTGHTGFVQTALNDNDGIRQKNESIDVHLFRNPIEDKVAFSFMNLSTEGGGISITILVEARFVLAILGAHLSKPLSRLTLLISSTEYILRRHVDQFLKDSGLLGKKLSRQPIFRLYDID